MNANQRLEDKEKALLNAEGEVAALNRRISNLEEELEKTEDRFVTNIFTYRKVANSSAFWLVHVSVGKGQLYSKTDWRAIDSPNKRIDEFFFTLHGKQIKFVHSFFGRIYGAPICFSVLSYL